MKNNNNKLFGGMGPEKAGELGGKAHHKCRGAECTDKAAHANDKQHKGEKHENKATGHKAATSHKK